MVELCLPFPFPIWRRSTIDRRGRAHHVVHDANQVDLALRHLDGVDNRGVDIVVASKPHAHNMDDHESGRWVVMGEATLRLKTGE